MASPAATASPAAIAEGASESGRSPLLRSGDPPLPATAENLTLDRLSRLGFPIGDVWVYTPLTDPDNLLGQPDQYVAKLVFQDARLDVQGDPASVDNGGAIEVFPDPTLAVRQREYLQSTEARMPA